jgi:hypothetical protein
MSAEQTALALYSNHKSAWNFQWGLRTIALSHKWHVAMVA